LADLDSVVKDSDLDADVTCLLIETFVYVSARDMRKIINTASVKLAFFLLKLDLPFTGKVHSHQL